MTNRFEVKPDKLEMCVTLGGNCLQCYYKDECIMYKNEVKHPIKVICISGKAMHGKDTCANIIKREIECKYSKKVLITHFGDLVKYICRTFFDWNGEKDLKGRTLLQYVGTDVVRKQKPEFWTKFIVDVLTMFSDSWDYVLIPDCRFPNEIGCFKDNGFDTISIRVNRGNFVSNLSEEQLKHISEVALDDYKFDYVIENNGGIYNLEDKIKVILRDIIK